ncbi:hypothetical protein C9374_012388 [Naegleria lovaniensis]|uniref:Uncharacterized protein n=1 Tax=Naegleria lovaniensis TaxID=51637 RepID=A0AA88KQ48_NAELO|nr:uncharacterized protein C9374_012388 [Naegleria lovaniensis]KAG2392136.1 hypothetical protein C9374_012388 [Naegleria lovaniensis]
MSQQQQQQNSDPSLEEVVDQQHIKRQNIWVCGYNDLRQLGIVSKSLNLAQPLTHVFPNRIVKVKCGPYFSIFIDELGNCFGTGTNSSNQLGIANSGKTELFPIDTKGEYIVDCECGYGFSIFINKKGHLFGAGSNNMGQILVESVPGTCTSMTPVTEVNDYSTELLLPFRKVLCGSQFSCYFTKDRRILVNGFSVVQPHLKPYIGKLKELDTMSCVGANDIHNVYSGNNRITLLTSTGKVHEITSAATSEIYIPKMSDDEQVADIYDRDSITIYKTNQNRLFIRGAHEGDNSNAIELLQLSFPWSQVKNIFIGGYHAFFIRSVSSFKIEIYGVGSNSFGQLSLGHNSRVAKPAQITHQPFITCLKSDLIIAAGASHSIFYHINDHEKYVRLFFNKLGSLLKLTLELPDTIEEPQNYHSSKTLLTDISITSFTVIH